MCLSGLGQRHGTRRWMRRVRDFCPFMLPAKHAGGPSSACCASSGSRRGARRRRAALEHWREASGQRPRSAAAGEGARAGHAGACVRTKNTVVHRPARISVFGSAPGPRAHHSVPSHDRRIRIHALSEDLLKRRSVGRHHSSGVLCPITGNHGKLYSPPDGGQWTADADPKPPRSYTALQPTAQVCSAQPPASLALRSSTYLDTVPQRKAGQAAAT